MAIAFFFILNLMILFLNIYLTKNSFDAITSLSMHLEDTKAQLIDLHDTICTCDPKE